MGLASHFLAAPEANKTLHRQEIEAFVKDLLAEKIVQLPGALVVGEARNLPSPQMGLDKYSAHVKTYVVPNDPGSMLGYVEKQNGSSPLLWYVGTNEQLFFEKLEHLPLGEKDCCICFDTVHEYLEEVGWQGAVIYVLTRPFPMEFCALLEKIFIPLADHPLNFYIVLRSAEIGAGMTEREMNLLNPLLQRHFGPHFLMRETPWE